MDAFVIPFKGLDIGNHRYDFEIGKAFFEQYSYFETDRGKISLVLELDKESSLMVFRFTLNGYMIIACDRCLSDLELPVQGEFRLIVKFGDTFQEESDEVLVIPATEATIDLSQYIFEFINLLLPIKKVHAEISQCDRSVIEKLEKASKDKTDPRWDALKGIKLK